MAERRKPLDEIERLRKEIEALRQERERPSENAETEKPPHKGPNFSDEIGDLSKHAEKVLEGVQQAAKRHPLPTVAAALAIGFIFGRITSR